MRPETVKRMMLMIAFIKDYQVEHGTTPSLREIGAHLGMKSPSQVSLLVKDAAQRNLIRHKYGSRRDIEVLP
jgi:SOS-response transcriptional repressor LexA